MKKQAQKAALYTALVFLASWSLAITFHCAGGDWTSFSAVAVVGVYSMLPMIIAAAVQKGVYGEPILAPFGIVFRKDTWLLLAWLLPAAFAGASVWFGATAADESAGMLYVSGIERYRWAPGVANRVLSWMGSGTARFWMVFLVGGALGGPLAGVTLGLGEEVGWRGLLQQELAGLGHWQASWLIGLLWGVWIAPLIALGNSGSDISPACRLYAPCVLILASPLISYVRLKADTIFAAALLRGGFWASWLLLIPVMKSMNAAALAKTGILCFSIIACADFAVFMAFRRREQTNSGVSSPKKY